LEKAMRVTLRRFAVPIAAMVAAVIVAVVGENAAFASYIGSLAGLIPYACAGLLAISVVTTAYNLIRVWRIYQRKE
jgi:hypothetical protein